ncbi:MAG: DUF3187 family protein [Holophagales bacterium]|nr:DUF3187 family protein [Holophagales bacterium]MYF96332.1 DUF3187 family protein [Holophagales bacterium]
MLAAASSLGAQEHRFGPLPVAEAWLGSGSGFLSLPIEAPASGGPGTGRWQVTASLGLSSFWLRSPSVSEVIEARRYRGAVTAEELDGIAPWPGFEGIYFADMEVHRLTLDARRRLGRRLELGLKASVVNADGGFVDPLIEGFHDFFGFRQSGRPQSLENGYALYFRRDGPGGYGEQLRFVRFEQAGLGLGETIVSLKSGLGPESATWRQAIQVQLKLPTADEDRFQGTGSVDAAIQYLVSRPWRRWTLHGNAGVTRLGSHGLLTLAPQNIITVAIAGERPVGPGSSIVLQLRHQQSPFRQLNLSILGVTATLIDIGWTRSLKPSRSGLDRSAYFSLSNNTAKYGSAVDISLHTGIRFRRN